MRLTGLTALAIALLAVPGVVQAASENEKAAALCDKLAAAIDDKTNPPGVKGIPSDVFDGAPALAPCEAAARAFPQKVRYTFQYARALNATKDYDKAFPLMKSAAEAGHAVAMNHLGLYYDFGWGTAHDAEKAAEWYTKSAERGVPRAAHNLGLTYRDGKGVPANAAAAEKWLTKAGQLGRVDAYSDLGWMYENALGVPQSDTKAAHWYQVSVKGGSFQGMSNLGWMYDRGVGGLPLDHEKAAQLYMTSAKGGNADGMNNMGASYMIGEGVPQDTNQGLMWLNKAYDAGSDRGAFNLGYDYAIGRGVTPDAEKAATYLVVALERQSTDAVEILIRQAGKKLPIAVIDTMQDALIKRGGGFKKEAGSFSTEALAYMGQIAAGK